jgi:site-specific recombinase XerD
MREVERAASSTIRRRLAALSSLYKHLVRHGHATKNPVGEVERPAINRDEGSTLAFAKAQARKLLDLPAEDIRRDAIYFFCERTLDIGFECVTEFRRAQEPIDRYE